MTKNTLSKTLTFLLLGVLCLVSFHVRLTNFKNSPYNSIDETVYYRLAKQLKNEFPSYNIIGYAQELMAGGRILPSYFIQPLFKHPPLYPALAAFSMKLFGEKPASAAYISVVFGVLMIPLVYLLGELVFSRRVAVMAAVLMAIDPITIICSQKVWMETTVAFFTLLAGVLFVLGVKRKEHNFSILAGAACGLAVWTRYTGILPNAAMALYALIYERKLFTNKKVILALLLPLILLIPWGYWNFLVYGPGVVHRQLSLHQDIIVSLSRFDIRMVFGAVLLVGAVMRLVWLIKQRYPQRFRNTFLSPALDLLTVAGLFLIFVIRREIIHGFSWAYLPTVTWSIQGVDGGNPFFYFGRLIEFSLFYLFALACLFLPRRFQRPEERVVWLNAFVILGFFVLWGNYQSRYILPSLPFLIVLGSALFWDMVERFKEIPSALVRVSTCSAVFLFVTFAVMKVMRINVLLSFPHNFCYF